jgi:hypothetical protein
VQRPHTSGDDGGLGHGDSPAGLDGVNQDGLHRRRRLPIAAAAAEEGREEGGGFLHGHGLSPASVGWKKEDGTWCLWTVLGSEVMGAEMGDGAGADSWLARCRLVQRLCLRMRPTSARWHGGICLTLA